MTKRGDGEGVHTDHSLPITHHTRDGVLLLVLLLVLLVVVVVLLLLLLLLSPIPLKE